MSESVPIEELEEVVQEWRTKRTGYPWYDKGFAKCADELQTVIEDYEYE